jgi:hypothetical protein
VIDVQPATPKAEPVVWNFSNLLWVAIAIIEAALVTARIFIHPGLVRLSMALLIPSLIILGAIINAIYNRLTIGHAVDDLPPGKQR